MSHMYQDKADKIIAIKQRKYTSYCQVSRWMLHYTDTLKGLKLQIALFYILYSSLYIKISPNFVLL